jgi:hypothetical protein
MILGEGEFITSKEMAQRDRHADARTIDPQLPKGTTGLFARSAASPPPAHPAMTAVRQLQQAAGNRALQQLLLYRAQPMQRKATALCVDCPPPSVTEHESAPPIQMMKYPLKDGDNRDSAYTIPETEASRAIAKKINEKLHSLTGEKELLKAPKLDNGKRDTSAHPSEWTEGYMIGVLVAASGKVYITCSGNPPKDFKSAVSEFGIFIHSNIPKEQASQIIEAELKHAQPPGVEPVVDDERHIHHLEQVHEHQDHKEVGATAGQCAAPKLIWHLMRETKEQPAAMSEILFAPHGKPNVKINDASGKEQGYDDDDIVPSCLTCQSLVTGLLKLLKDYRERQAEEQEAARKEREAREAREKEYARQDEEERQRIAAFKKKQETAAMEKRLQAGQEKLTELIKDITKKLQTGKYKKMPLAKSVLTDVKGFLEMIQINADSIQNKEILADSQLLELLIEKARLEQ